MSLPADGSEAWTVGRLIEWTTQFFRSKGIDTPRLDAELLLGHVLEHPRIALYTQWDEAVAEPDRSRFRELIRERGQGCPVAYLLSQREFYSLRLTVSRAVLIPRPETEVLVDEALAWIDREGVGSGARSVLDIGTGSGAIALALASQRPELEVTASDLSAEALAIARSNAAELGLVDRVRFIETDLAAGLVGPFDLVVSNPPYVASGELMTLAKEVRDFEPHLALDGGSDGLDVIRRLLTEAGPLLRPGGGILIEIGAGQQEAIARLLPSESWGEIRFVPDPARIPRVMVARKLGNGQESSHGCHGQHR